MSVDDFGEVFLLTAKVLSPIDPGRICSYMKTTLEGLVEALNRAPEMEVRNIKVFDA
jgi:hypothetical protein